jgi:transcriptional regulator with XRE-family HTH domain
MAMRAALMSELKRALREGGFTYADVARKLQLSLASVKRLFASENLSLERLDRICELIGTDLASLAERAREPRGAERPLTLEQERAIVADPGLFLITWLLLSRTPFQEIVRNYRLSAAQVQRYLIRLDRLKVIELQPGNRARLLISRRFSWRPGGPVQRFLHQKLLREFLEGSFAEAQEVFFFHGDALSEGARAEVKRVLQLSARECLELIERDQGIAQPREGTAFLLAMRPWQYSGFVQLRRK